MWQQLYILLTLATLLVIANSLSCYECNAPTNCSNPELQICNNETAIFNSQWLTSIYQGVTSIKTSMYVECLHLTYLAHLDKISRILEFKGCVFTDIHICYLPPQSAERDVIDCHTCNWDRCNRNPANTFSQSVFTIFISLLSLVFIKVFLLSY